MFSMPYVPFLRRRVNRSEFYGPDDDIPLLVAILMGIQRMFSINNNNTYPITLKQKQNSNNFIHMF